MPFDRILRGRRCAHVLSAIAAASLLASPLTALAQPPAGQIVAPTVDAEQVPADSNATPTTAREWFARGEAQYRVGQYQVAADAWTQAYALDPRPRIQYNLAQAYERLGRLEAAIHSYETFTAAPDEDEAIFADALARLTALRQRVDSSGLMLHGGPNGGEIVIDGQAWGVTPRPDRIPLTPGNHRVEIRYPADRTFRASFSIPAGQVTEVEVTDDAIIGHITDIVEVEAAPTHTMLYVGIGMAGAGLTGLIYGIERQVKVSDCNDPNNFCDNLATGERQRTIGLAVGGTLTAAGAALIVVDLIRHSAYQRRSTALTCAPLLAGATCRLRF